MYARVSWYSYKTRWREVKPPVCAQTAFNQSALPTLLPAMAGTGDQNTFRGSAYIGWQDASLTLNGEQHKGQQCQPLEVKCQQ